MTNAVLIIGVVSLLIGILLRVQTKETIFSLAPSSFLEFSIAAFLLTIALELTGKK